MYHAIQFDWINVISVFSLRHYYLFYSNELTMIIWTQKYSHFLKGKVDFQPALYDNVNQQCAHFLRATLALSYSIYLIAKVRWMT